MSLLSPSQYCPIFPAYLELHLSLFYIPVILQPLTVCLSNSLSHAIETPFTFPLFVNLTLLSSLFLFCFSFPSPSFFLATPLRLFEGNSLLPIFEKFLFLSVPSLALFFLYTFELSSPWPGLLLLFVSCDTRIYISSPYFWIDIQILMSSLAEYPTDSFNYSSSPKYDSFLCSVLVDCTTICLAAQINYTLPSPSVSTSYQYPMLFVLTP